MEPLGTAVPGSAEAALGAPNIPAEPARRRTGRRDSAKAAEGKASAGTKRQYVITLHDSKEIPPGGQMVGVNGVQYRIPAGRKVRVPAEVLEVLDAAVQSVPELNDAMQVIGYRDAPRLTYTLHRDED
jgi:hypothetical protein